MPRSRAPGCAVWRVRAAHAPAIAPLRGAPAGACASRRQPLTDTDVSASGCRRAPERPAHAPGGRSHGINHLGGELDGAELEEERQPPVRRRLAQCLDEEAGALERAE